MLLYDAVLRNHARIQPIDSSLRGAQALKKKGLKGKWIGVRT